MRPFLILAAGITAASPALAEDTSLDGLKDRITGRWTSFACEIRPTADPDGGVPTPTYLLRDFTYGADDSFAAAITVFGDPACTVPLVTYDFAGYLVWHEENPAAPGAWSQDYVLNKKLEITVKAEPMAARMNNLPPGACGDAPFEVGVAQDILGKPCVLLRFVEGSDVVIDHDLLYVREDTPNMLFMGGKHVNGAGFYYPENRPTVGLQQPLLKAD
ncbi:MAG: hypothetical protein AAFR35_09955 [Pseudomonadota bacterium]